jgi:hypothetical protein
MAKIVPKVSHCVGSSLHHRWTRPTASANVAGLVVVMLVLTSGTLT